MLYVNNPFQQTLSFRATISNGGLDEYPRECVSTESDLVSKCHDSFELKLVDGKLLEREDAPPNYIQHHRPQYYIDEGNVPNSAISERASTLWRNRFGVDHYGYDPIKPLERSYVNVAEGNQSIDIHGLPRPRKAAMQNYKETVEPYLNRPIENMADLIQAQTNLCSNVSENMSMDQPFRQWPDICRDTKQTIKLPYTQINKKVRVSAETDSSSDEDMTETDTDYKRRKRTIFERSKIQRVNINVLKEYTGKEFLMNHITSCPSAKAEKRAQESRNIEVHTAGLMINQKPMEDLGEQTKGLDCCSVKKSNDEMFAEFADKSLHVQSRGKRVVYDELNKMKVLVPRYTYHSIDLSRYNKAITPDEIGEFLANIHLRWGNFTTWVFAAAAMAPFYLRASKALGQVSIKGFRIGIGLPAIGRKILTDLKTLQEKGEEYLYQAILADRSVSFRADGIRGDRYKKDCFTRENDDTSVLPLNPGHIWAFIFMFARACSGRSVDVSMEMGMGTLNKDANGSQSHSYMSLIALLEKLSPIWCELLKKYGLPVEADATWHHNQHLAEEYGEEFEETNCHNYSLDDFLNMTMLDRRRFEDRFPFHLYPYNLCPSPVPVFPENTECLQEKNSYTMVQKSDDSAGITTAESEMGKNVTDIYVYGFLGRSRRKPSTTKGAMSDRPIATLYAHLFENNRFEDNPAKAKRAIFPTGLSPHSDLSSLSMVCTELRHLSSVGLMLAVVGTKLHRRFYRLHCMDEPLKEANEERTQDIHKLINLFDNLPMVLGGKNIITNTRAGMDFAMQEYYYCGEEYSKLFFTKVGEAEMIAGQLRTKVDDTVLLSASYHGCPTAKSVKRSVPTQTRLLNNETIASVSSSLQAIIKELSVRGGMESILFSVSQVRPEKGELALEALQKFKDSLVV